jgi:hypothetical protein
VRVRVGLDRAESGLDAAANVDADDVRFHVGGYWLDASIFAVVSAAKAYVRSAWLRVDPCYHSSRG